MALLDAPRSIARIAGTALRLGGERAYARFTSFPMGVEALDPDWLSGALAGQYPGVRASALMLLDQHSGTTSRARIRVEYAAMGDGPEAPPANLFVKLTPRPLAQRLFLDITGIGRNEVRFYRDLRPGLPVRAPRLHGVSSFGGDRVFVMLLEDLGERDVRLAAVGDRVSLEEARGVVCALARLHAHFWESERFADELAWVPCYERRVRRDLPWERFVTGQMVRIAVRRFGAELAPELREIAALCTDARDGLERLWAEGEHTLCHGDCHVGNLFFEPDAVGFLDWQVCARAPGMRDVSYFLCTSFPSSLRAAHEHELIDVYLGALAEAGAPAPERDVARRQHRLFALYTFIAAAFTAAAGGELQSEEIAMAGLRRATRAAIELGSVAAARALI